MDHSSFFRLTSDLFKNLTLWLESSYGDLLDIDLRDDLLTLTLEDGSQFIFNRHLPSLQVWLSSPLGKGYRFSAQEGWAEIRTKKNIKEIVEHDLNILINHAS